MTPQILLSFCISLMIGAAPSHLLAQAGSDDVPVSVEEPPPLAEERAPQPRESTPPEDIPIEFRKDGSNGAATAEERESTEEGDLHVHPSSKVGGRPSHGPEDDPGSESDEDPLPADDDPPAPPPAKAAPPDRSATSDPSEPAPEADPTPRPRPSKRREPRRALRAGTPGLEPRMTPTVRKTVKAASSATPAASPRPTASPVKKAKKNKKALATASVAPVPSPTSSASPRSKGKARKKKGSKVASLAPPPSPGGEVPSPASSAAPARKKGKKGKKSTIPTTSASPGASPSPASSGKDKKPKLKPRKRGEEQYARTGEEAPITVEVTDRTNPAPVRSGPDIVSPLKPVLMAMVDRPTLPLFQEMALSYLGFLGCRDRLPVLVARLSDKAIGDVDKLQLVSTLVDCYGDTSHKDILLRVVDDPKVPTFQLVWAHEILLRLGDKSRIAGLQKLVNDPKSEYPEKLRGLRALAGVGDTTCQAVALKISNDGDIFLATRLEGLAALTRMDPKQGTAKLEKHMKAVNLSVEERLSIAFNLMGLSDKVVGEFFEKVVERQADTIFDQLRAIHGLALMGKSVYLGTLHRIATTRKRTRLAALRMLVLMGDRSRVGELLTLAKMGDLDAVRALVVAHLMDSTRSSAGRLHEQSRYRALVAP